MSPSRPEISSYTILPLCIPPTPSFPHETTHTIYLRPHTPKIPTPNDDRSLFLVNLPIDSTTAHLRSIFSSLIGPGKFEDCSFENERRPSTNKDDSTVAALKSSSATGNGKKRKRPLADDEEDGSAGEVDLPKTYDRSLHRSGSSAVVTLVDAQSVSLALKTIRKLHRKGKGKGWPIWDTKKDVLGSKRYKMHHKLQFPSQSELQRNVDHFMSAFNSAEEQKKTAAKMGRNVVDEDGFITVTRGGRIGPARQEEVERKRVEMEEKERKKRGEMGDFYRFQMRERRKEEAGEMVRRFEEDRKRVEGMRRERGRFRPER